MMMMTMTITVTMTRWTQLPFQALNVKDSTYQLIFRKGQQPITVTSF